MGARGRKSGASLSVVGAQPAPDPARRSGDLPEPPPHLSEATKKWWHEIVSTWALEVHQVRLLQLAGEAWDLAQKARQELARDGLTFTDERGAIKAHPCVMIERDARTAFARLLRDLALKVEPPKPPTPWAM
jgi:P27 family predicted phage terminase small subunit